MNKIIVTLMVFGALSSISFSEDSVKSGSDTIYDKVMTSELDKVDSLDKGDRKDFEKLYDEYNNSIKSHKLELDSLQNEIDQEKLEKKPDTGDIKKHLKEQSKIKAEMEEEHIKFKKKVQDKFNINVDKVDEMKSRGANVDKALESKGMEAAN